MESCCCFTLRTGCIVIAIYRMMLVLVFFTMMSLNLFPTMEEFPGLAKIEIVCQTVFFLYASCLLLGTLKRNTRLLLVWIVATVINITLGLVLQLRFLWIFLSEQYFSDAAKASISTKTTVENELDWNMESVYIFLVLLDIAKILVEVFSLSVVWGYRNKLRLESRLCSVENRLLGSQVFSHNDFDWEKDTTSTSFKNENEKY